VGVLLFWVGKWKNLAETFSYFPINYWYAAVVFLITMGIAS